MFLFFLKTRHVSELLLVCILFVAGCSLKNEHKAEDKKLYRTEAPTIQGEGTLNSSDAVDRGQIFACEKEARILLENASLRESPHGEIVRALQPGDAVFMCGTKDDWFIYGYVEEGYPVGCPEMPDLEHHCFIGWSEFELSLMIAG